MTSELRLLRAVQVDEQAGGDVTFFFEGSEEPFSVREFEEGSRTRSFLEFVELVITRFNAGEPGASLLSVWKEE